MSGDDWIDVLDALPDDCIDVLTWRDDCQTVAFLRAGRWYVAGVDAPMPAPGFWQHLPEGPAAQPEAQIDFVRELAREQQQASDRCHNCGASPVVGEDPRDGLRLCQRCTDVAASVIA